jgi:hypothetical protein
VNRFIFICMSIRDVDRIILFAFRWEQNYFILFAFRCEQNYFIYISIKELVSRLVERRLGGSRRTIREN